MIARKFVYPARLASDKKDGGYVVTFRDIPEAITQGDTIAEALSEAAGALQAAIEAKIMDGMDIPTPSRSKRGERLVAVPVSPRRDRRGKPEVQVGEGW